MSVLDHPLFTAQIRSIEIEVKGSTREQRFVVSRGSSHRGFKYLGIRTRFSSDKLPRDSSLSLLIPAA